MNNYYENMDLKYVEKAICLEKFYIHNPGVRKFYIPSLIPLVSKGTPNNSGIRVSKNHLLNKNKSAIRTSSSAKISNYIEIELPNYITAVIKDISVESQCSGGVAPEGGGQCSPGTITTTVKKTYFFPVDENDYVPENQEFIVAFVGGDYNNRKIIGRYK